MGAKRYLGLGEGLAAAGRNSLLSPWGCSQLRVFSSLLLESGFGVWVDDGGDLHGCALGSCRSPPLSFSWSFFCLTPKSPPMPQQNHVPLSGSSRDRSISFSWFPSSLHPLNPDLLRAALQVPHEPPHGVPNRTLALSPSSHGDAQSTPGDTLRWGCKSSRFATGAAPTMGSLCFQPCHAAGLLAPCRAAGSLRRAGNWDTSPGEMLIT